MSSDIVLTQRPRVEESEIQSGRAVRSRTWMDAAAVYNWISSHGRMLVPTTSIVDNLSSARTYRFRAHTTTRGTCRIWLVTMTAAGADPVCTYTAAVGSNTYEARPTFTAQSLTPAMFVEEIASPSTGEAQISIVLTQTSGTAVMTLLDITCYEAPLPSPVSPILDAPTRVGLPIKINNGANAIQAATSATTLVWDRGGVYHWGSSGVSVTATSYSSSGLQALPAPVLGQKRFNGDTTRNLSWRVYAVATGTNGSVRLTAASGDTSTITVTAGGGTAWYPSTGGAAADIDVDAEDMTASDGLRSSTFDTLTLAAQRGGSGGGDALTIYGVSVWETPR